ncbi:MAG: hypothetical protein U9Q37_04520 [Euryarchaeota archaeon]|nr:hypothetical protein [Euryarchaeota archaeon]
MGERHRQKKFRQKMADMNTWLKSIRNRLELDKWWKLLELKLIRHQSLLRNEWEHVITRTFTIMSQDSLSNGLIAAARGNATTVL